jgi:hypothetical protein
MMVGNMHDFICCGLMLTVNSDPISSTMIHTSGSVVATCSGQRSFQNDQADIEDTADSDTSKDETTPSSFTTSTKSMSRTPDNSLNLWSL